MKTLILLCTLLTVPIGLLAQHVTDFNIATEVDEQIWEPFKQSYLEGNAEVFNGIHTDDVLRITGRGIKQGQEYKDENIKWLSNPSRVPRAIDFVFEHRIYGGDYGYEIGYYKISDPANPEKPGYHARFTVLLRKVDGIWKIAQDWDTNDINGHRVNAEDFEKLKNK